MVKFVVVEDEKSVQDQIRQLLRKISVQTEIDIDIEYFSKYNEKLQKEKRNKELLQDCKSFASS